MIIRRNRPPKPQIKRMIVRRANTVGAHHPVVPQRTEHEIPMHDVHQVHHRERHVEAWTAPESRWEAFSDLRVPRRVMLGIIAASVGIIVIGVGYVVWASPLFQIRHLSVEGSETVPAEDIEAMTALRGQSIFTANFEGAQQEILKIPQLKNVHVEREWPSTVKIVVEDRQPWGIWRQGPIGYVIDRDGVVLSTDLSTASESMPLIRASGNTPWRVGDRVNYQAVDAAAELYQILPQRLGLAVSEVAFVPGSGVQVTTADGQLALFGDSSSISYKVAVWEAVQRTAKQQHINYARVDLRYGNRPVVQ